ERGPVQPRAREGAGRGVQTRPRALLRVLAGRVPLAPPGAAIPRLRYQAPLTAAVTGRGVVQAAPNTPPRATHCPALYTAWRTGRATTAWGTCSASRTTKSACAPGARP